MSVRDLYDIVEVVTVDNYNKAIAAEMAREEAKSDALSR